MAVEYEHIFCSWIDPIYIWAKKYDVFQIIPIIPENYNESRRTVTECKNSLTKIIDLELNLLQISHLPDEFEHFTGLKSLSFSGYYESRYFTFEDTVRVFNILYKLINIEKLSILLADIKNLPHDIDKLVNLQRLSLSYLKLETLPHNIDKLVNLQHLSLSDLKLKTLPQEIQNLSNLKSLSIEQYLFNQEIELIKNISTITSVTISGDELLPITIENLSQIKKLTELDLFIESFHPMVDFTLIKQIVSLSSYGLDSNFETLPKSISSLQKLEMLTLSSVSFKDVPKEVFSLINLWYLDIDGWGVKMPKDLNKLTNLTHLRICNLEEDENKTSQLRNFAI